ncbi:uncharacterized protein N7496_008401 [Penicillium cataractarum]|uniref:Major facilitator superfamily (MFS) profile domain-containing protein n=1 Tax=Penicillium cataractarum TaxID=2100454 RepID=A0A9W9RYC8_9EURO|nr:uncharacterized protein N7496_008401 [Penicillium cataractarum]KAJ5368641.1 hypothetical protein N7496_008401 [Penicillium cataractarum]
MAAQTNKDGAEAIEMENPPMTRPAVLAEKLPDGDEALQILQTEFVEYSAEEERRLRWKIDLRLVSVMLIVNGIQFVDKLTISYAATYGMITEAHLKGQEYSLLITLFYIGYLVAQYPTNYLMQRFPTGKYLTVNFILWGITLAATGSARSFATLAPARFFLGVFESCLNPGFVLISSSWWKREEQAARIGLWYSANGLASVPAGVLFWAIAHINVDNIFPYQWMFIIFGALTVLVGASLWWVLPDTPLTCQWLSDRERIIAVQRLKDNRTGVKNIHHKKDQVIETLSDYRVWMLLVAIFCHNMTNSLQTNFTGIIIKGFGYNTYQAVLLQIPVGAIMAASMILVGFFLSSKWGQGKQIFTIIACYIPGIIACGILYGVPVKSSTLSSHLAAIFLIPIVAAAGGMMYSILAANIAGYTKKTVTGTLFFSAYCVANIISPQTFLSREAPKYTTGVFVTLAAFIINIILFSVLYVVYSRENAARRREIEESGDMDDVSDLANAFSDLTDRQNRRLIYKV